jgi:hypothetical protein
MNTDVHVKFKYTLQEEANFHIHYQWFYLCASVFICG